MSAGRETSRAARTAVRFAVYRTGLNAGGERPDPQRYRAVCDVIRELGVVDVIAVLDLPFRQPGAMLQRLATDTGRRCTVGTRVAAVGETSHQGSIGLLWTNRMVPAPDSLTLLRNRLQHGAVLLRMRPHDGPPITFGCYRAPSAAQDGRATQRRPPDARVMPPMIALHPRLVLGTAWTNLAPSTIDAAQAAALGGGLVDAVAACLPKVPPTTAPPPLGPEVRVRSTAVHVRGVMPTWATLVATEAALTASPHLPVVVRVLV